MSELGERLSIRQATPADADPIARLHAASWRLAYRGALSDEFLAGGVEEDRRAVWQQRLIGPDAMQGVWVAEQAGAMMGFACAYAGKDPRWGTLLDNLHVSAHAQRLGVGTRLLRAVAAWSLAVAPTDGLFLWVVQSNLAAQRFYAALGARRTGADVWSAPDGGSVPRFRFAWQSAAALPPARP